VPLDHEPRRGRVCLDPEPIRAEPISEIVTDRLDGAPEISRFLYGTDAWRDRKKVYRAASSGELPIGKIGARLIASKKALIAAYEKITTGDWQPK
jgi:hypothetical protein